MPGVFCNADAFNPDIGAWDVSGVTDMNLMFNGADSFSQDLSGWCVRYVSYLDFATGSPFDTAPSLHPVWGTCP